MKNYISNLQLLKNKSILYIEDEENIRKELTQTLQLLCRVVFSFALAEEALEFFKQSKPDIILSDISLGDLNGLEFTQRIRQIDKQVPVILLSAHTDTSFLLQATKLKLVDYLTKPITYDELLSSLFLALKELEPEEKRFVNISKEFKFDILHKVLYENENIKKLSASETTLLDFLINNKDRTITTQEIKNYVWEDSYYATDTALKSLIHKLRNKIGKNTIKNVSGIGYYIVIE